MVLWGMGRMFRLLVCLKMGNLIRVVRLVWDGRMARFIRAGLRMAGSMGWALNLRWMASWPWGSFREEGWLKSLTGTTIHTSISEKPRDRGIWFGNSNRIINKTIPWLRIRRRKRSLNWRNKSRSWKGILSRSNKPRIRINYKNITTNTLT